MNSIALILHICFITDTFVGLEQCRVVEAPFETKQACEARADKINNSKVAEAPRFYKREEARIGEQVIVAPAHCEVPWHPTRNPMAKTRFNPEGMKGLKVHQVNGPESSSKMEPKTESNELEPKMAQKTKTALEL